MPENQTVTIALREESRNPGHVLIGVFIGRNKGSRGRSGTLTLRTDEWDEIATRYLSDSVLVDILPPLLDGDTA